MAFWIVQDKPRLVHPVLLGKGKWLISWKNWLLLTGTNCFQLVFQKVKEYLQGSSLASKLQAKHDLLKVAVEKGTVWYLLRCTSKFRSPLLSHLKCRHISENCIISLILSSFQLKQQMVNSAGEPAFVCSLLIMWKGKAQIQPCTSESCSLYVWA